MCELKDQLISAQSLLYIICAYWQFEDICASGLDWTSWASKERRKEKLKGQLEKGMPPLFCHVHRSACFPTLDVILWDGRPKTRSELQNSNIWKPGRFDLVGLGFAGFHKHFYRECARSKPLLHVFKKTFLRFAARRQQADVLYANGGIGFCKYEARKNLWTTTFALSSRVAITGGMKCGRPSKIITFLWRHEFPSCWNRWRELVSNPVSLLSMAHAK